MCHYNKLFLVCVFAITSIIILNHISIIHAKINERTKNKEYEKGIGGDRKASILITDCR